MKKIFNHILEFTIVALSTISCTFAYTQEQEEAYQRAYRHGITTQPTIKDANMGWNITRQEFSKMIVNYLENLAWVDKKSPNLCSFTDENKANNELRNYAKKACAYNIMWTKWNDFRPRDKVTRAELWTVISRILWWDEYDNGGKRYYIYHLNALKYNGIMNDIDNPVSSYTKRWEVMIMLKRIYEKFGRNISMNWYQISAYDNRTNRTNNTNEDINNYPSTARAETNNYNDENDDYIDEIYSNSNIIYEWKDGSKYYYDDKFLNTLKNTAEKKWESDLAKYLEIEAKYFENWIDQIESLDLDSLPEMLGFDEDIDIKTMTTKEKETFFKKIKEWINKLIKTNKERNSEYIDNLEKITEKINNDKFWLKDKYKETKSFIEASNEFLDLYSEILIRLVELAATSEDWEINDEEAMGITFSLLWSALAYQGVAEKYQSYIEEWAINTIELLGWELGINNTNNNTWNNITNNINSSNKTLVCTLNKSDSYWINVNGIYTVNYSGKYVNLVDTIETVNSDSEEWIEYYKYILEETYKPYNKLKYYDYNIKTTKNTLTSKVTINYEKIDMNKFLEINPNTIFIENGKVSLEKLRWYYELIGATCE